MGYVNDFKTANLKKIDFVYPGGIKRSVIVQDILMTKDGRYVLEYLEYKNGKLVPDYTEIIESDNIWWRYPFKKRLSSYDFVDFELDDSNRLIDKIPNEVRFKVFVKKETKEGKTNYVNNEFVNDTLLDMTGSSVSRKDNKYVFMVLLATDQNNKMVKKEGNLYYKFDFPFPTFSFPLEVDHEAFKNSSLVDENYDSSFKQDEYTKENISMSIRRAVSEFLNDQDGEVIDITKLPVLEVQNDDGDKIKISFVSCPNLNLFNEIFKAESLLVDKEGSYETSFENQLESALHYERPLTIVYRDLNIATNGVQHSVQKNNR
jgi:hypothetical protein